MIVYGSADHTEYKLYFDQAQKGQVIMTWGRDKAWGRLDQVLKMLFDDIEKYKASKVILGIDSNTECEFLIKQVFELPYR